MLSASRACARRRAAARRSHRPRSPASTQPGPPVTTPGGGRFLRQCRELAGYAWGPASVGRRSEVGGELAGIVLEADKLAGLELWAAGLSPPPRCHDLAERPADAGQVLQQELTFVTAGLRLVVALSHGLPPRRSAPIQAERHPFRIP